MVGRKLRQRRIHRDHRMPRFSAELSRMLLMGVTRIDMRNSDDSPRLAVSRSADELGTASLDGAPPSRFTVFFLRNTSDLLFSMLLGGCDISTHDYWTRLSDIWIVVVTRQPDNSRSGQQRDPVTRSGAADL